MPYDNNYQGGAAPGGRRPQRQATDWTQFGQETKATGIVRPRSLNDQDQITFYPFRNRPGGGIHFMLCIPENYTDANGVAKTRTEYILTSITTNRNITAQQLQAIRTGMKIHVKGKIKRESYASKKEPGKMNYDTVLDVYHIEILEMPNQAAAYGPAQGPAYGPQAPQQQPGYGAQPQGYQPPYGPQQGGYAPQGYGPQAPLQQPGYGAQPQYQPPYGPQPPQAPYQQPQYQPPYQGGAPQQQPPQQGGPAAYQHQGQPAAPQQPQGQARQAPAAPPYYIPPQGGQQPQQQPKGAQGAAPSENPEDMPEFGPQNNINL